MKRSIFVKMAAALTAVVLMASGCGLNTANDGIAVTTAKVKLKPGVGDTLYTGAIKASQTMKVIPNTSARVVQVAAALGQKVEKGAILFKLDDSDFILQQAQAQAAYEAQVANYEKTAGGGAEQAVITLRQSVDKAQNELADAQTAWERVKDTYDRRIDIAPLQLAYDDASASYERMKTLNESGAEANVALSDAKTKMDTAKAQLDSMENTLKTNLESAESRLRNAKTALAAAQENLSVTVNKLNPENTKNAKAQMEQSLAALEIAKKKVADTTITAPMTGVVAVKTVEEGDMISNQSAAMEIYDTSWVETEIFVTEGDLQGVFVGMGADIGVQATGQAVKGNVSEISPVADSSTGMFLVKLRADNTQNMLSAGMTVSVRLLPEEGSNTMLIPEAAIKQSEGSTWVFVIEGGKAVKKDVETRQGRNGYAEVTKGLEDGQRVIVSAGEEVEDGAAVSVIDNG